MVIDRLADMVSIINTGIINRDQYVLVRKSKLNIQILYILYKNGVINNFHICSEGIVVFLKYIYGKPVLRHLKRYPAHNRRMQWSLKKWNAMDYKSGLNGFYIASSSLKYNNWLNYKSGHYDLNLFNTQTGGIVRIYATV